MNETVYAVTAQPIITLNWRVPHAEKISDGMPYALEMLGLVLDGTDSSRYSRKLQRGDAVALGTSAGYTDFGRKNAIFSVFAMPNGQTTPEELKKRLLDEIRDIAENGVGKDELALIRTPVETERIFARDSISSQADTLGELEHNGFGWKSEDEIVRRLFKVTPKQVQSAARLLLDSPMAQITVLPQQAEQPQPPAAAKGRLKKVKP